MTSLSAIVCCYNSASRLPRTLEHLQRQVVPPDLDWDVVVVDNASIDDTASAARAFWSGPGGLTVVSEPRPGKSHAFRTGVDSTRGDLIIIVDDDNWLNPDFLSSAKAIMDGDAGIGACGGPAEAVTERPEPAWFAQAREDYAAGDPVGEARDITWTRGMVWGAGCVIRRVALERLFQAGYSPLASDRTGNALVSGGDAENCYALRLAGWKIWYDPRLAIQHYMPSARLEWNYLRRLHRGFGASTVGLEAYHRVFEYNPESAQSRRHFRWQTQVALTLLELARLRRAWAAFPRRDTEGNWTVLAVERHLGRLQELLRWRQRYDRAIHEVWAAPWRTVTSLPATQG